MATKVGALPPSLRGDPVTVETITRSCGSCVFFRRLNDQGGSCFFAPPQPWISANRVTGEPELGALRPVVAEGDLCAHHAAEGEPFGEDIQAAPLADLAVTLRGIEESLRRLVDLGTTQGR